MKNPDPSIVFFGTSSFALPSLEALVKNGYRVLAAITKLDQPAGRKNILTSPPVKILAEKLGVPVFQPERLNSETFKPDFPKVDLFIVVAFGKIIPQEILDIPKFKSLNIHPSLLPRWRGPSPIQYAILNGDTETGVTIMQMDEEMDHGPVIANVKIQMTNAKITYPELHDVLAQQGADLLIKTLPKWIVGEIIPQPQDHAAAAYSKIITKEDGRIDWKKPAVEIERMVRAFTPWPGAWTVWRAPKGERRIRIEETEVATNVAVGRFGWVADGLVIQTGEGGLAVRRLTIEAGRTIDVVSFLRGHSEIIGVRLV